MVLGVRVQYIWHQKVGGLKWLVGIARAQGEEIEWTSRREQQIT
ncbi:MAG: hypothetical protein WBH57_01325 [Anaerolineae bacterium]